MKNLLLIATAATSVALGGCNAGTTATQGLAAVHVPVVSTTNFVFDAATRGGALGPQDTARLDGWFAGLGLDFGDRIYLAGDASPLAAAQVAEVAGRYGLLLSDGMPVASNPAAPGTVRVVVARSTASVPGCPDWSSPSNPDFANKQIPNYGCGVNGALAAQVANPQDLVAGSKGASVEDAVAAAKAIQMYRNWPLTGITDGQSKRALKSASTTKKDQ